MNKYIGLFLGGFIILSICTAYYMSNQEGIAQLKGLSSKQENIAQKIPPHATHEEHLIRTQLELVGQKLNALGFSQNFQIESSNHDDSIWFQHQIWQGTPIHKTTLTAKVNHQGECFLVSHYTGKQRLQHFKVYVKVGETIYDSSTVANTHHPLTIQQNASTQITEEVTYVDAQDLLIIESIANSKEEEKIAVLFVGEEQTVEVELPLEDREAIRECYQLQQKWLNS